MKGPSSALLSPLTPPGSVVLLALLLGSLFHSSLYVPILTPSFSQIKTSGCLFLLSSSFIVPLTLMFTSKFDSQHHNIKTLLLSSVPISNSSCYSKILRATKSIFFPKPDTLPHTEPTSISRGGHFAT